MESGKSVYSHLRRGAQTNEAQSLVGERRVSILMESVSPHELQRQIIATHNNEQVEDWAAISHSRVLASEGIDRLTPSFLPSPSISYLVRARTQNQREGG